MLFRSSIYTETHVKCLVSKEGLAELVDVSAKNNWHPSKNPFAVRDDGKIVQFVNRRFYGNNSLHDIDKAVDELISKIGSLSVILEIKYESAIYDTNEEHDRWWMK